MESPDPAGSAGPVDAAAVLAMAQITSPSTEAKNEYRMFTRQASNRDKFPVGLQASYKNNKVDLFNTWRRCGKDWGKTELLVKRSAAKITESTGEKSLVKVRDLVAQGMPLERAIALREKRKKENLVVPDADFPDVEDELSFWHTTKVSAATINRTEEIMSVEGRAQLDGADLEEVIGDDGVLCAGLHVAAPGVGQKNQMSFAESLGNLVANDGTGKLKLTAKPKIPVNTEEVQDQTPRQIAMGVCDDIQKEIKEAQGLEMMLKAP